MADEQVQTEEKVETIDVSNSLQEAAFGDNVPPLDTPTTVASEVAASTEPKVDTTEEIIEPKDWLKREFEVDDPEVLKQQIKEYRELKAKPQDDLKFENDQSKQLYELIRQGKKSEVRQILEMQDKIEGLVSAEVNDDTAADIIKLSLRLKYKDLTDKEIEYKFNKMYSIPKEPVKGDLDDDDEFAQKHQDWQEQVADIKMNRVIEAKTVKPELEKAKAEIVLPEIQKENQSDKRTPTPEELEAFNKEKDSFLQSAKEKVNGFNGFTVQVKDKDVDYAVNYAPSQEEKTFISDKLNKLAEAGFDANELFADRWYDMTTKTFKIDQMTEDLSRIFYGKNADQKLAIDSANKRIEAYLKEKKQINVNETNVNGTFSPSNEKTEMDAIRDLAFA